MTDGDEELYYMINVISYMLLKGKRKSYCPQKVGARSRMIKWDKISNFRGEWEQKDGVCRGNHKSQ